MGLHDVRISSTVRALALVSMGVLTAALPAGGQQPERGVTFVYYFVESLDAKCYISNVTGLFDYDKDPSHSRGWRQDRQLAHNIDQQARNAFIAALTARYGNGPLTKSNSVAGKLSPIGQVFRDSDFGSTPGQRGLNPVRGNRPFFENQLASKKRVCAERGLEVRELTIPPEFHPDGASGSPQQTSDKRAEAPMPRSNSEGVQVVRSSQAAAKVATAEGSKAKEEERQPQTAIIKAAERAQRAAAAAESKRRIAAFQAEMAARKAACKAGDKTKCGARGSRNP